MCPAVVQVSREEFLHFEQAKKEYNSKKTLKIGDLLLPPKETPITPVEDGEKHINRSHLEKLPISLLITLCKSVSYLSMDSEDMIQYLSSIPIAKYSRKNILLICDTVWPGVKHKNVSHSRDKLACP